MIHNPEINDQIVRLHDIARVVEKEIGIGELSKEIRDCADKLSELANAVS